MKIRHLSSHLAQTPEGLLSLYLPLLLFIAVTSTNNPSRPRLWLMASWLQPEKCVLRVTKRCYEKCNRALSRHPAVTRHPSHHPIKAESHHFFVLSSHQPPTSPYHRPFKTTAVVDCWRTLFFTKLHHIEAFSSPKLIEFPYTDDTVTAFRLSFCHNNEAHHCSGNNTCDRRQLKENCVQKCYHSTYFAQVQWCSACSKVLE